MISDYQALLTFHEDVFNIIDFIPLVFIPQILNVSMSHHCNSLMFSYG